MWCQSEDRGRRRQCAELLKNSFKSELRRSSKRKAERILYETARVSKVIPLDKHLAEKAPVYLSIIEYFLLFSLPKLEHSYCAFNFAAVEIETRSKSAWFRKILSRRLPRLIT
jgi:hypothetical protein